MPEVDSIAWEPAGAPPRYRRMGTKQRLWLIDNKASGSNTTDEQHLLEECCGEAGFTIAQHTHFPARELPSPAMLDAAGIELVAVFAGDGTINAVVKHLAGWSGAVLVLAGGTMNLLYHRLHGTREVDEVVRAVASGAARKLHPHMIRGDNWEAMAGLMAGPGTSWNSVREAMREGAILDIATNAVEALDDSLGGAMICCTEPPLGRREGYPLILLRPAEDAIVVLAYHAETPGDYLAQSVALLKRDFREGPHEELGRTRRVVLASTDGEPFGLLVDGEPAQAPGAGATFELAAVEVDLWASE